MEVLLLFAVVNVEGKETESEHDADGHEARHDDVKINVDLHVDRLFLLQGPVRRHLIDVTCVDKKKTEKSTTTSNVIKFGRVHAVRGRTLLGGMPWLYLSVKSRNNDNDDNYCR